MKRHIKNHFKKVFQIVASIALFTLLIIQTGKNITPAKASVVPNMHGAIWAYMPTDSDECIKGFNASGNLPCVNGITGDGSNPASGQGLGWALMNSNDNGDPVPYGVSLDVTTGALSGYAWNSDEGISPGDLPGGYWIDFSPAGPYPQFQSQGISDGPARIEPNCFASTITTTCPVIGWIRYLPGTLTDPTITGDWDGWVSLQGAMKVPPVSYGVTYDKTNGTFIGDAWGDSVAGWVRFPKTISTVQVDPLTCTDNSGGVVITHTYYPGQPLPPGCVPINDLCTNIPGVQSALPWLNTNSGIWYDHYPNDPVGICKKTSITTCTDTTASNYGQSLPCTYPPNYCQLYPQNCGGGSNFCKDHPDLCANVDQCSPLPPGDQTGSGPWQVSGAWYGLSGGVCKPSVCPNYTDTYYATPPTGEVVLPDGNCGKPADWCASHPCTTEPGGKLKPIYKEN